MAPTVRRKSRRRARARQSVDRRSHRNSGHWQPGKGAAKHGRESRAASSVRLLQRRIDDLRDERGPAPPDPLTFTAPDAADTGDAILLEAAGIAVHGRVTQPPDSPIRLGARGRLVLRGTNGAGKSTLLSVLASQLAPDTGTLTLAPGVQVGLLAQEDDWNPNRTPADVLGAWDLDQIRATGLLADADLGRPLGELSVGQRRRVTLACVLLNRPSVLLLDEPTNHLSVTLVDALSDALLSTPAAVVLVTHDRTLGRMVHNWPTLTLSPVARAAGVDEVTTPQAPTVSPRGHFRRDCRSPSDLNAAQNCVADARGQTKAGRSPIDGSPRLPSSSPDARVSQPCSQDLGS